MDGFTILDICYILSAKVVFTWFIKSCAFPFSKGETGYAIEEPLLFSMTIIVSKLDKIINAPIINSKNNERNVDKPINVIMMPTSNDFTDTFESSLTPAMLFSGYVTLFFPLGINNNRFGTLQTILLLVKMNSDLMKK